MSARAAPRGRAKAPAPIVRRRPPARTKKVGLAARLGRLLAMLPIPRAFLLALRRWALILLLIAGIVAGLVAMGLPQAVAGAVVDASGAAGLRVDDIQLKGCEHVDCKAVYRTAIEVRGPKDTPLIAVDLERLRTALLNVAWVQDARVSRRLPDTLVIDIVERAPVAIWQYQQRLALVDKAGEVIAPLDPQTVPDQLPLVIGREANRHALDLAALLATQPAMKPLVQDAAWVGDRRWDLHFGSGETLSLPEGEGAARAALASFARKDSEARLLGKGIDRFDMRDPARMIVRVTREPGLRLDKVDPAPATDAAPPPAVSAPPPPQSPTQPQAIAEKIL